MRVPALSVPDQIGQTAKQLRVLSESRVQLFLFMLRFVDELFTRHKIIYWVCGGTLLGALRHGGFIPHDDDIDIECLWQDQGRIARAFADLRPPFSQLAYHDSGEYEVGEFRVPMGHIVWCEDVKLNIDIFFRCQDEQVEFSDICREFAGRSAIFPLQRLSLYNVVHVWAPGGPELEAFLGTLYRGWRTKVAVWSHGAVWEDDAMVESSPEEQVVGTSAEDELFTFSLADYESLVARARLTNPLDEEKLRKNFTNPLDDLATLAVRLEPSLQHELWLDLGWASPLPPF